MTQVAFKLDGSVFCDFSIEYRVYQKNAFTSTAGWLTWVRDGQLSGDGKSNLCN